MSRTLTFQPSAHSRPALARRNASASSAIATVASSKPRSGSNVATFLKAVQTAIEAERGSSMDSDDWYRLESMASSARSLSDPKALAPLFGEAKQIAESNGAPQTSGAITTSAKWFYENVEEPGAASSSGSSAGRSSSGGTSTTLAPSSGGGTPIYKKRWFWPVVILGVTGIGVTTYLLWPDGEDEEVPLSRRERRRLEQEAAAASAAVPKPM